MRTSPTLPPYPLAPGVFPSRVAAMEFKIASNFKAEIASTRLFQFQSTKSKQPKFFCFPDAFVGWCLFQPSGVLEREELKGFVGQKPSPADGRLPSPHICLRLGSCNRRKFPH
jgi:hypothetical protein